MLADIEPSTPASILGVYPPDRELTRANALVQAMSGDDIGTIVTA